MKKVLILCLLMLLSLPVFADDVKNNTKPKPHPLGCIYNNDCEKYGIDPYKKEYSYPNVESSTSIIIDGKNRHILKYRDGSLKVI